MTDKEKTILADWVMVLCICGLIADILIYVWLCR